MKRILFVITLCLCFFQYAGATPQVFESLMWHGEKFGIMNMCPLYQNKELDSLFCAKYDPQ